MSFGGTKNANPELEILGSPATRAPRNEDADDPTVLHARVSGRSTTQAADPHGNPPEDRDPDGYSLAFHLS